MLNHLGCSERRARLFSRLGDDVEWAVITSPEHLIYFANFVTSPFVFNSTNSSALALLSRNRDAVVVADNVQESFLQSADATERVAPVWYRCIESARSRREAVIEAAAARLADCPARVIAVEWATCPASLPEKLRHRRPETRCVGIDDTIVSLRRSKDDDELAVIDASLRAADRALRAAMAAVRPGMTELDLWRLVVREASAAAGGQVSVYGDFVSGPRCEQIGGPPTARVIERGDLVLLDFSVVIDGYRGDFCNTFVCGAPPTARQRSLFDACRAALDAGAACLRPGVACRDVYAAVRQALEERGVAEYFPHHAGHGIGLGHPEAPYLVPESAETLEPGDVVTLEPGVYLPGVAGMRYEHDYLITPGECVQLSHQPIEIDACI